MAKAEGSSMTVEEVIRRRAARPTYEKVPTRYEGVSLRVEKDGDVPRVLKKALGRLAIQGATIAETKAQIKPLETEQKEAKAAIQEFAIANPGFRGFESEEANVSVTANPTHKLEWNIPELEEALGPVSSAVISEDLVVTITVPLGLKTAKGLITSKKVDAALRAGVRQLGFNNKELGTILSSEVVHRVDEVKIDELVVSEQVTLPDKVAELEETWAINAEPLHKA